MPARTIITLVVIAALAMIGGFFTAQYVSQRQSAEQATRPPTPAAKQPASVIGFKRIDFSLKDTAGKSRKLSDWDGQVILLNFWATWCPPCRREIPAFIELHDKYHARGLVIVGVALDTPQAAVDFVDPMGINYPILVGEEEGINLTQQYGNRLGVLPYSVLIDRQGKIVQTFAKELTFQEVEKHISPLL